MGVCAQEKGADGVGCPSTWTPTAFTDQPLTVLLHESCRFDYSPGAPWGRAMLQQRSASSSLFGLRLASYQHFNVSLPRREMRDKPCLLLCKPASAARQGASGSRAVRGAALCQPGVSQGHRLHPLATALPSHADILGSPARCWHP